MGLFPVFQGVSWIILEVSGDFADNACTERTIKNKEFSSSPCVHTLFTQTSSALQSAFVLLLWQARQAAGIS
jgi:hypothetical protein